MENFKKIWGRFAILRNLRQMNFRGKNRSLEKILGQSGIREKLEGENEFFFFFFLFKKNTINQTRPHGLDCFIHFPLTSSLSLTPSPSFSLVFLRPSSDGPSSAHLSLSLSPLNHSPPRGPQLAHDHRQQQLRRWHTPIQRP